MLVWGTFFLYSICFNREWGHPILNYALPHLAWVMQFVAVVVWAVMSEVKFAEKGECENDETDPDEALDICATSGPILIIF